MEEKQLFWPPRFNGSYCPLHKAERGGKKECIVVDFGERLHGLVHGSQQGALVTAKRINHISLLPRAISRTIMVLSKQLLPSLPTWKYCNCLFKFASQVRHHGRRRKFYRPCCNTHIRWCPTLSKADRHTATLPHHLVRCFASRGRKEREDPIKLLSLAAALHILPRALMLQKENLQMATDRRTILRSDIALLVHERGALEHKREL